MEDWQTRVIDERNKLSSDLVKLERFINGEPEFLNLPRIDQKLMIEQQHIMSQFRRVLDQRIERFEKAVPTPPDDPELPNFEYTEGQDKSGGLPLEPIPEASEK